MNKVNNAGLRHPRDPNQPSPNPHPGPGPPLMVTATSQGDLPGVGGKSQKSFIGRTLRWAGVPTFQGELRGGFWGALGGSWGWGELLVGSSQNCPQLGGQEGLWGGAQWPLLVRGQVDPGSRVGIRARNLHLECSGGQVRPS